MTVVEYKQRIAGSVRLHPMSHVEHRTVYIGARTCVWQFASVIRGAKIGRGCSIGSRAIVDGSRLGNNVSVGHGAQIHPGMVIGDNVFVGPGAIFCNDRWPRTIKQGWSVQSGITIVERGASIGANVLIMPGTFIGERAMVAGGAVLTMDVPADHIYRCGQIFKIESEAERLATRIRMAKRA